MPSHYRSIQELFTIAKQIDGINRIHNIIFILKQIGADFNEQFSYSRYSPFSNELQLKLDYLKQQEIISNGSGELHTIGEKVTINSNEYTYLNGFEDQISELNQFDKNELELIATAFYLNQFGYDRSSIEKKLKIMKPDLEESLSDSLKYYDHHKM